mgnify:CR=1 FL=1|tara:strand:+ start:501 stop:1778 length:1278 start_codon:yes stop_codon:yes gene_type:complete
MANPGNKGAGTGTAVLKDYSGLNRATSDFFKGYKADAEKAKAKKDAASAAKGKALAELRGDFGDYDTSKMRESDKDAAVAMNEDSMSKFSGHWGDILNGDPEWSNLYREEMNKNKIFISNSVESKQEMKDLYSTINEPDSGYSPEKKKQMEEYMLATGSTMKGMKDGNLYAQDVVVGEPLKRMDAAFLDSGTELYTVKKGSYINKNNEKVAYDKQNWKPDSEALPIFKSTISNIPRMMNDLEIMYPGEDLDSQVQKFYDKYKESREVVRNNYDRGRAPVESKSNGNGWGDKRDKYDFAVREIDTSISEADPLVEKEDSEAITIGKKSGSPLTPITVNGTVGVVSEIKKDGKGNWVVVRNITKDDLQGNYTFTGETVTDRLDEKMAAHLESEYGIPNDIEGFSKELKAKNSAQSVNTSNVGSKYNK